jgi:RNA polymerase sigma-70 factor, ECF subfamily
LNWHELRAASLRAVSDSPSDVAEDAVQEAVIRAWRTWSRSGLPENPAAWLTTVTRREVLRWLKGPEGRAWKSASSPTILEPLSTDEGSDDQAALLQRLEVQQALQALSAQDRLLLLLRYRDGRTQAEIAWLTGIPEGTAKVRLHRARHRLRVELS